MAAMRTAEMRRAAERKAEEEGDDLRSIVSQVAEGEAFIREGSSIGKQCYYSAQIGTRSGFASPRRRHKHSLARDGGAFGSSRSFDSSGFMPHLL